MPDRGGSLLGWQGLGPRAEAGPTRSEIYKDLGRGAARVASTWVRCGPDAAHEAAYVPTLLGTEIGFVP